MSDYEVSRTAGACCVSGHVFAEDESFFSVIVETDTGFERRDYSSDAWPGPPDDSVCHFQTKMPRKESPKKTFVDDSVLLTFFDRLAKATEPAKQRFRFVLALILLRKRILRYENSRREGEGEVWILRRIGDRTRHEIYNPGLSEKEIGEVTSQLGAVLHSDFVVDADEDGSNPDDEAAAGEASATDDTESSVADAPDAKAVETADPVGEEARS